MPVIICFKFNNGIYCPEKSTDDQFFNLQGLDYSTRNTLNAQISTALNVV
jgi:hypothetical protein